MRYILVLIICLSVLVDVYADGWGRGTGFGEGKLEMNNFPVSNTSYIMLRENTSDPDVTDSNVAILFIEAGNDDLCIRWDNHDTEVIETHP